MEPADETTSTLGPVPWIRDPSGPRTTLLWGRGLRERLGTWARARYPHEACGLLLGRTLPSGACALEIQEAENVERERPGTRFEVAPEDLFRIESRARADGLEVVGVWHSHPDHPARPSRLDRDRAWEGYSWLIASVSPAGVLDVRSWRLFATTFVEEILVEQPA